MILNEMKMKNDCIKFFLFLGSAAVSQTMTCFKRKLAKLPICLCSSASSKFTMFQMDASDKRVDQTLSMK